MNATDPPRCLICVPVDIGNGATHRDDCPNYITHLRAERDEAPGTRMSRVYTERAVSDLVAERDSLQREVERLRAAIEEHRTQIVSVVQSEYDGHAADEALWEALSEPTDAPPQHVESEAP